MQHNYTVLAPLASVLIEGLSCFNNVPVHELSSIGYIAPCLSPAAAGCWTEGTQGIADDHIIFSVQSATSFRGYDPYTGGYHT